MRYSATEEMILPDANVTQPTMCIGGGTQAKSHVLHGLLFSRSRQARTLRLVLSVPLLWVGIGAIRNVVLDNLEPSIAVRRDFVQE